MRGTGSKYKLAVSNITNAASTQVPCGRAGREASERYTGEQRCTESETIKNKYAQ